MRLMGRYLQDDRLSDDKQTIVRDGFNQPIDEKGKNLTIGATQVISNRMVNEARFGYVSRTRGLLANNAGVPNITFDDGTIAFGNLADQPGRVHAEDVPLGRHGVDVARQPRRQVRRRSAAHPRRLRLRGAASGARSSANMHDFAMDEVRAVTIIGINPSTGLIEPNVRNFRFWEIGRLLPGRLEDPIEPDAQPRHPARVVRPAVGGERPADQHHPRARAPTSSSRCRTATVGRGRSGRAGRLQQLRAAPRLLVGSVRATASSRCAAATASPTSGCSTTRSRTSASTRRTTRSPSPTR